MAVGGIFSGARGRNSVVEFAAKDEVTAKAAAKKLRRLRSPRAGKTRFALFFVQSLSV